MGRRLILPYSIIRVDNMTTAASGLGPTDRSAQARPALNQAPHQRPALRIEISPYRIMRNCGLQLERV
jgi:hypothetical protein